MARPNVTCAKISTLIDGLSIIKQKPYQQSLIHFKFTRRWKIEQAESIAERDSKAQQMIEDWRAEALKELETWHAKKNEV